MRCAHPRRYASMALILGIAASLAAACSTGDDNSDDGARLSVVATTQQIAAIAREVGGDRIDLRGIVPAGADSHEFEPVASDLRAIEGADVILRHGVGLDDWLDDTLSAADGAAVTTVTDGIVLEPPALAHDDEGAAGEGPDEHADEEGLDPHVWHDPERAILMTQNVVRALAAADTANAGDYEAAGAAYEQTLRETKAEVQAIIDEIPPDQRKMVTNHDAFGYFARAFGLEIVGAVIPSTSTEAEASAQQTAELLELIERENVRAIFAESSVNASLAESLANDAGIAIVDDLYGDSLGEEGSGADTVHGMLLANARTIADALK